MTTFTTRSNQPTNFDNFFLQFTIIQLSKNFYYDAGLDVFVAMKIKVAVFWVVIPCSDVVGQSILEDHTASIFTVMMETALSSKMLVSYVTTWCHNPEDCNLKEVSCLL
jgi:hypothetical protein